MDPWVRLDNGADVEKVGFRTIVHKKFQMNDGRTIDADITGSDGSMAAAVIALTPDNQVIVARQFRCGPEQICDEMPGGIVDPGETPEQAALRELQEESGYTTDELTPLGAAHINSWNNTVHHYFIARNCRYVGGMQLDEFEEIEPRLLSITEFIDNAKNARMTDVQGVFLAYDTLKELEKNI